MEDTVKDKVHPINEELADEMMREMFFTEDGRYDPDGFIRMGARFTAEDFNLELNEMKENEMTTIKESKDKNILTAKDVVDEYDRRVELSIVHCDKCDITMNRHGMGYRSFKVHSGTSVLLVPGTYFETLPDGYGNYFETLPDGYGNYFETLPDGYGNYFETLPDGYGEIKCYGCGKVFPEIEFEEFVKEQ